ncbi:MAG: hypothetical protein WAO35_03725, partial [Terriglobia bacterium]
TKPTAASPRRSASPAKSTRQVNTVKGENYNLSFDLAGSLGLDAAAIAVLVDGVQVATYDPTSPNNALNWVQSKVLVKQA